LAAAVPITGKISIGEGAPLALIAGPCIVDDTALRAARYLKELCAKLNFPFLFKCSFDKANRTSLASYRGSYPTWEGNLEWLDSIKREADVPLLTDVHCVRQVERVAEVADVIQIPALLSRQTDLIVAAAETNKPVNIKKGQFMAPQEMEWAVEKASASGEGGVIVTERGTSFGYNNLVVDFRSLAVMGRYAPVVFDAGHSVQLPGGKGVCSDGEREFIAPLARAAVAFGVDAIFLEVHENPDQALCDGPNSLPLVELEPLLSSLLTMAAAARGHKRRS
jgi:2-dehydro-3-deoxyphosphooctonate aldolase (KDO 8-P synthase)